MKANVGELDRSLRIIVGLLLVDLTLSGLVGAWAWIGLLPLATGVLAWCPLYLPWHRSTYRRVSERPSNQALREAMALQGRE